jgi:hypothetical protein
LNIVRFFLDMMTYRYPNMLTTLIVYNLPWILNAAWKIVRGWLSAEQQRVIVFVTTAEQMCTHVDAVHLPSHMGGSVSSSGSVAGRAPHPFTTPAIDRTYVFAMHRLAC